MSSLIRISYFNKKLLKVHRAPWSLCIFSFVYLASAQLQFHLIKITFNILPLDDHLRGSRLGALFSNSALPILGKYSRNMMWFGQWDHGKMNLTEKFKMGHSECYRLRDRRKNGLSLSCSGHSTLSGSLHHHPVLIWCEEAQAPHPRKTCVIQEGRMKKQ